MEEDNKLKISPTLLGRENRVAVLVLDGEVDSNTANILKEKLLFLGSTVKRFILDFSRVTYMASAGWGVVLSRIKENRESGGDIVFANMTREVFSIYDLLELHKVIKYFPGVEEGLEFFGEKMPAAGIKEAKVVEKKEKAAVPVRKLTLEDAIRKIVRKNPLLGASQIKKILELPQYGFEGLSRIRVYLTLRQLRLHSKAQKLYYAWQEEKRSRSQ